MRLICTIPLHDSEENPYEFSYFLTSQNIRNTCEEVHEQKETLCRIWIVEEDALAPALAFYKEYKKNPKDPKFHVAAGHIPVQEEKEELVPPDDMPPPRRRALLASSHKPLSTLILIVVIGLFVWGLTQRGVQSPPALPKVEASPLFPPIDQLLLYDYPHYFEMRDQLLTLYTPKEIEEKVPPSAEALSLLQEMEKTPYWTG